VLPCFEREEGRGGHPIIAPKSDILLKGRPWRGGDLLGVDEKRRDLLPQAGCLL